MPVGIAGSFNVVDVRDLAESIVVCTEKGLKGEGYILSNDIITFGDIFTSVAKYTGAKHVKVILPQSLARIVTFFTEAYGKITKKSTLLTSFILYNLSRNNTFSCEKATKELGYSPRPFEETIRDTIIWLTSEGKINPKNTLVTNSTVPITKESHC